MRRWIARSVPLALAALCLPALALAQGGSGASGGGGEVDWLAFALGTLGGLVLFLFAVDILARNLRELHGGRFQKLLEKSSSNRFGSLATGTVATVVLDSSSVTIILMIAIVDAGLIGFANALPAILGANIGTTFSSQLFAWNVDEYAPIPMAIGLLWRAFAKEEAAKRRATIVLGLGLVLFALSLIGNAAEPLKEHPDILEFLKQLEDPLLGVLAGALITVVIQSSSAMMGIVIVLAGGGIISLPAGIALMLGAEIGTCADTLIATIGRSRPAVKAGIFHLLFNIVSVAIGIALIGPLTAFAEGSAGDTGLQIANAHVLFNVAGALLALPFVRTIAGLLDRIVPERAGEERRDEAAEPQTT